MKLSGTYKYFKILQLIKALFLPMLLFTQADYKSAGKNTVALQLMNVSDKIISVQKGQLRPDLNNFRIHGFNPKKIWH